MKILASPSSIGQISLKPFDLIGSQWIRSCKKSIWKKT